VMTLALSDVALAATAALGYVGEVQVNGTERPRCGNDLYGAFGAELSTADGRRLYAVAISRRQWDALLEATGSAAAVAEIEAARGLDFGDEGDRFEARRQIKAAMQAWTGDRPLVEVAERLDACGVCWGPYQTFTELVARDPRCSPAGGLLVEVDQPGIGQFLAPVSPLTPIDSGGGTTSEASADAVAPVLGEHTDEVLAGWLGLSSADIGRLHDEGIVAGAGGG